MDHLERLALLPFSYAPVGGTAETTQQQTVPPGYRQVSATRRLGTGRALFDQASELILGWEMHRRARFDVRASAPRVGPGVVAVLRVRVALIPVRAPVRVVYVVDEPDCRGFAYGTLPGHPEQGEERFVVRLAGEEVIAEISAFSRPGRWWVRLAGPVGGWLQDAMTERYLRALPPGPRRARGLPRHIRTV